MRPTRRTPSTPRVHEIMKRIFDFAFSLAGLLVLLPLLALMALWIKLDSKGPVFYRGIRRGRFGKPFRIYKFRTMVADAEKVGPVGTVEGDPRVTRAGAFLRKSKLDELPQLINVLKGQMSLVGPRPEADVYLQYYTEEEKEQILSVRPGITDYSSLKFHDEGRLLSNDNLVETYIREIKNEKVKIQMRYIREQSLWVDLKIILETIRVIFTSRLLNRV